MFLNLSRVLCIRVYNTQCRRLLAHGKSELSCLAELLYSALIGRIEKLVFDDILRFSTWSLRAVLIEQGLSLYMLPPLPL